MANPFKDIFSNIKVFSGGDNNSAIGIDIGSSAIKVVEIKKKGGKAMLETYGAIALGPYAELNAGEVTNLPVEKLALAMKEVLKQSGALGDKAEISIPVQSSLIFTIELPAQVKESEIANIVPNEARRYIPVPITEVSLDYFMLPKKEASFEEMTSGELLQSTGEKTRVLVVATQNDAISKYRSIASQAGLKNDFFEIEIFSSIRSNFEHELSLVLLIDFGASKTKLSLVEFGMVKGYHTIDRGSADITKAIAASYGISFTQAEKMKKESGLFTSTDGQNVGDIAKTHIDYIFSEANNVLLGHEKKYGRTITKVILSGGGSLLKGLEQAAAGNFRAEVQFGRPFSKVGAPEFLSKVLAATGPEFAVALGLALRKLQ
jgi:type IV pilus assembly protein PilM